MSDRPRWERVVAVLVLLLVIAPFVYFAILRSQQKTIGVDFARVGEVYQRNMLPGDWKLVQTYDLTIMGRSYRLYHYDDPGQMLAGGPFFTIGDEYGVLVDSQGLITEISNGDDALHHRLQELETQRVIRKKKAGVLPRPNPTCVSCSLLSRLSRAPDRYLVES